MNTHTLAAMTVLSLTAALAASAQQPAKTLRAGMIGLDTSHVPAFTRIFNNKNDAATWPASRSSPAIRAAPISPPAATAWKNSPNRLRDMKIEIVDTIPELLEKVDVVMLESVDGRIHLQEAIPVIKAGKPLWIDKPRRRLAGRRDRHL